MNLDSTQLLMLPEADVSDLVAGLLQRPAWHTRAACRGLGLDAFFPSPRESLAEARSVCARCPVAAECRQYALGRADLEGVWAGLSGRERRRLRRQQRAA